MQEKHGKLALGQQGRLRQVSLCFDLGKVRSPFWGRVGLRDKGPEVTSRGPAMASSAFHKWQSLLSCKHVTGFAEKEDNSLAWGPGRLALSRSKPNFRCVPQSLGPVMPRPTSSPHLSHSPQPLGLHLSLPKGTQVQIISGPRPTRKCVALQRTELPQPGRVTQSHRTEPGGTAAEHIGGQALDTRNLTDKQPHERASLPFPT